MSLPQKDNDKETQRMVVRYLRDHPDFFEAHLDLLADMVLPHERGTAVSLLERQVSVLRDQKDQYKNKLQGLIKTAEQNERLNQKINQLVLQLLDCTRLEEMQTLIPDYLRDHFDTDAVMLRLFHDADIDLSDLSPTVITFCEKVIAGQQPVCGQLKQEQLDALFSESTVPIHSAALIPLLANEHSTTCYGLLAIGSRQPDRFRADMGTLFLSYLGQIISRAVRASLTD